MTSQGQTLVEFLVCMTVVWFALLTASYRVYHYWNQSWCAYLTFEEVCSSLMGAKIKGKNPLIRVQDRGTTLYGLGKCGDVSAEVELPKLESAHW